MSERRARAEEIAREAGALALGRYRRLGQLDVTRKGHHDLVSEADLDVETLIRKRLSECFPQDGLIGEEHAPVPGTSGVQWIIDPIDGTSNFLASRPTWCVALACVKDGRTELGVIFDPCHDELFVASRAEGAWLNDAPMRVAAAERLSEGATGIGHSRYSAPGTVGRVVDAITQGGGTIVASGSGALSIAYVAAGRTLGHIEGFMRAWDCLAALLMVEEAGGRTEGLAPQAVLAEGTRIVVGAPAVFETLKGIADTCLTEA